MWHIIQVLLTSNRQCGIILCVWFQISFFVYYVRVYRCSRFRLIYVLFCVFFVLPYGVIKNNNNNTTVVTILITRPESHLGLSLWLDLAVKWLGSRLTQDFMIRLDLEFSWLKVDLAPEDGRLDLLSYRLEVGQTYLLKRYSRPRPTAGPHGRILTPSSLLTLPRQHQRLHSSSWQTRVVSRLGHVVDNTTFHKNSQRKLYLDLRVFVFLSLTRYALHFYL